ncbi:hypothetical protein GCM10023160_18750 [Brachybacterium paraconglomeratum]|uniref:hypothetical protein n=1 Tax=Brachybacterium paraconglomeratum TaxID=173362 RepID=UPI0031F171B5
MTQNMLNTIDLEMQKAQEAYAKKIARLKKRAADEEKRVITKLVEVLKTEHEDIYEEVRADAVRQLEQERAERSKVAKEARGHDVADDLSATDSEGDEAADDAAESETFAFQRSA